MTGCFLGTPPRVAGRDDAGFLAPDHLLASPSTYGRGLRGSLPVTVADRASSHRLPSSSPDGKNIGMQSVDLR